MRNGNRCLTKDDPGKKRHKARRTCQKKPAISDFFRSLLEDWGIRWGSIHQRERLKPKRQIWCRSAVPWINVVAELPGRPTD
jgi:hypothetical protein